MALREYDFENIPTVSIVKKTLTDAIKMEATDIHFDPTPDELVIKFRINGDLKEYTIAPENVKTNIIARIKIISGMNINDSLIPQTGTINFELDNKTRNMQVSSLPVLDGEKIVVHISNYANNIKNLNNIGFTESNTKKIKNLLKESQGIILITGNTNSGKTTTTYSILKELNNKNNNIISIEDPVKMKIKGINQVQIAPEKGLTYRNILKSVMLQDPNIIAINELVDDETTRAALRASLSGRLVISTMHTKTVFQTIDTLLNMDIENYLLGSNISGIISQRLVKKLCPTCRKLKHVTPYEASVIKEILGAEVTELYYPNGCSECNEGYIEQIPIAEVIEIDEELRNAISNNRKRELIRNIINENSDSIIKDGLRKVIGGKTSFEEIIRIMDLRVDFTNEDKKIKDIILGNGLPTNDEETKKSIPVSEKQSEDSSSNEEKDKEHEEEKSFIKVELDNNEAEEKNNITNLQISETELKDMLSKIEENATTISEEKEFENNIKSASSTSVPLNKDNETTEEPDLKNNEPTNLAEEVNEDDTDNNISTEEKTIPEKEESTETQDVQEKNTTEEISNNEEAKEPSLNIEQENNETDEQSSTHIIEQKNEEISEPNSDTDNSNESSDIINNDFNQSNELNNNIADNEITNDNTSLAPDNMLSANNAQEIQPINFDDNEDDDDFNYGNSYINNF